MNAAEPPPSARAYYRRAEGAWEGHSHLVVARIDRLFLDGPGFLDALAYLLFAAVQALLGPIPLRTEVREAPEHGGFVHRGILRLAGWTVYEGVRHLVIDHEDGGARITGRERTPPRGWRPLDEGRVAIGPGYVATYAMPMLGQDWALEMHLGADAAEAHWRCPWGRVHEVLTRVEPSPPRG